MLLNIYELLAYWALGVVKTLSGRGRENVILCRVPRRLFLSCLFCVLCISTAQAEEHCIVNFGTEYCGNFSLEQAVIIKSALNKPTLEARLERPVQQLAILDDAGFFLVASDEPETYAKTLAQRSDVLYAQPDLRQKRRPAAHTSTAALPGVDLPALWAKTKGAGIKIAVIDDGFELTHEAFRQTRLAFTYDADRKKLDASPKLPLDHHGTRVAGLIFAAHDGRGAEGVAPEAELIAIRQPSTRTSDTLLSLSVAALAKADVVVCSWNSPVLMEPVRDIIVDLAHHGRNGLGTAIVFAAGNEGRELVPLSVEAAIPEAVTVATTDHYSNYGQLIDFTLPGTYISTTAKGYGPFSGTSAAAPVVGGYLALSMARNPQLSLDQLIAQLQGALNAGEK